MGNMDLPNPTTSDSNEKTLGLVVHILAIFTCFLGPLIMWLLKKDESPFVAEHAKEALNFQLCVLIGYIISSILACFLIGLLFYAVVWVLSLVFEIQGAMAANKGLMYRYPLNVRMIK
jgi:uncharacterized Tic20 family protein